MIPVRVDTLLFGAAREKSAIILRPLTETGMSQKVLPIYIGMPEAYSISLVIEGRQKERPQTHDLLVAVIEELEGRFARAIIDRVDGMMFYSRIVLEQDDDVIELDARPSDAIALALRFNAPIYVEAPVFMAAAISYDYRNMQIDQREFEEFHDFVQNLNPDDFTNSDTNNKVE